MQIPSICFIKFHTTYTYVSSTSHGGLNCTMAGEKKTLMIKTALPLVTQKSADSL